MRISEKDFWFCVECEERFSSLDVACFDYFLDVMTCRGCLERLQQSQYRATCFGKLNKPVSGLYGFNSMVSACKRLCQDRELCEMFTNGEMKRIVSLTERGRLKALAEIQSGKRQQARQRRIARGNPFNKGSISRRVFDRCLKPALWSEVAEWLVSMDADPKYYLKMLRKEFHGGKGWTFHEYKNGRVKVTL
jgi:hypothetical protein